MQTYSNIIMAMQASATCLWKECSSTTTYNISFKLVQHLLEKKKCLITANCAKSVVNQGKPSFEDAHMYVYVYIYTCVPMYVYAVLKVNSFLANLCSIPPRKCNMSLQQIPSMMQ